MADHPTPLPTLIRSHEIRALIPYSLNHIRRLEQRGEFPRRVRIGDNRVAWLRQEVEHWIDQRVFERETAGRTK